MEVNEVLKVVEAYGTQYVTVTGGEPLAQKACHQLLKALCDAGYSVSLETGGAMDIADVDQRVSIILDIKTPGSNEEKNMLWKNVDHIKAKDELKFVLCGREDYDWAKEKINTLALAGKCSILFSPSFKELDAKQLAAWVLQDQLPVRMQVQLHKILWGEKTGV